MGIYILSFCDYSISVLSSIHQTIIRSKRDIVNANKINIYILLVHIDWENVQETPDFYVYMETHFMHTYDA